MISKFDLSFVVTSFKFTTGVTDSYDKCDFESSESSIRASKSNKNGKTSFFIRINIYIKFQKFFAVEFCIFVQK